MGAVKIKLLFIKRFIGERLKLKGFLIQMHFKITQEAVKLTTPMDQVVYTELFLTERAFKQFKPYLTEIQINNIMSTNLEVKYIFLSWGGFVEQLMQMFKDLEVATTAERKL